MYITFDWDAARKKGIIKSDFLENIRAHFSVFDDKAALKKKVTGFRFIKDRKYIITDTGRFDIGLFADIVNYLNTCGTPTKLILSEEFKKQVTAGFYWFRKEPIATINFIKNGIECEPRYYQKEAVVKSIANGRGINLQVTAAGKSLIIALLDKTVRKYEPTTKTLIMVPNIQLVEQIYKDFLDYGTDPTLIGKWSGEYEFEEKPILVCSTSILYDRMVDLDKEYAKSKKALKDLIKVMKDPTFVSQPDALQKSIQTHYVTVKKEFERLSSVIEKGEVEKVQKYLNSVTLFITDEVHKMGKGTEINNIFDYITTPHCFGFSGTLPPDKINEWNIIGKYGPVVYTTPREELVEQKFIADVEVSVFSVTYQNPPDEEVDDSSVIEEDDPFDNPTAAYYKENIFIENNTFRNNLIKKMCTTLNKNSLVLVNTLSHLEILLNILKTIPNKQIHEIKGEIPVEERERIRAALELSNNNIIVAMGAIFSTGININNLHYGILANARKAKVSLIQSLGRFLRMPKDKAYIFDITSDNLRYESRHFIERMRHYEQEKIKYRIIKIRET